MTKSDAINSTPKDPTATAIDIQFSHIHLYVDRVSSINEYKTLEASINTFYDRFDSDGNADGTSSDGVHGRPLDVKRGQKIWESLHYHTSTDAEFVSHGRDVVKQLIAGFGFRVTGCYPEVNAADGTGGSGMNTVLITSSDPEGIQIFVSSLNANGEGDAEYLHFDTCEYNAKSTLDFLTS